MLFLLLGSQSKSEKNQDQEQYKMQTTISY